jgi:hypothetical protein
VAGYRTRDKGETRVLGKIKIFQSMTENKRVSTELLPTHLSMPTYRICQCLITLPPQSKKSDEVNHDVERSIRLTRTSEKVKRQTL